MVRSIHVLVWGVVILFLPGGRAHAGECFDAELCAEPCPAENSCLSDADCPEGTICIPDCLPSVCVCDPERGWNCTDDCAGECREPPIPAGPHLYDIIDLGTLGGWTSVALAINEKGQVVGSADTPEGLRHAYLWEDGVMTDLGTLGSLPQTNAWGINNHGQVVGSALSTGDIEKAFIWENGQMRELGDPAIAKSAFDINDAGQVVGALIPPGIGGRHAFRLDLETGVMTDLTELGFPVGIAWGVNAQGDVAGGCCLWTESTAIQLGTLGGTGTGALDVNDFRHVVGQSERVPGEAIFHAFLWRHGEMTDLGAVGGFEGSMAMAINNVGQVVGSPSFLYDGTRGMLKLEDLLPIDHGWFQLSPRNINDNGQIVGAGTINGLRHAFLMNPLPPEIPAVSNHGVMLMTLLVVVAAAMVIARPGRAR